MASVYAEHTIKIFRRTYKRDKMAVIDINNN